MRKSNLRALATDATGKLDVLRHDGDTLGVDGAQVGVFEQANGEAFLANSSALCEWTPAD